MNTNQNTKITYQLAPLWKVFFARLIDIIIVSIVPFLTSWFIYPNHLYWWVWLKALFVHCVAISFLFFYFILIPYFFNGCTFGKFITRIRIICPSKKKISFGSIMYRELFIIFIPWLLIICSNLIITYIFKFDYFTVDNTNIFFQWDNSSNMSMWVHYIVRMVSFINLFWYITLLLIYKLDKKHQVFFDVKLGIYVINYSPIVKDEIKKLKNSDTISREQTHIHLKDIQPGNIDDSSLKDIENL